MSITGAESYAAVSFTMVLVRPGTHLVFLSPLPSLLPLTPHLPDPRPLTIAQMQGRFQMLVVPHSGHAIQARRRIACTAMR